MSNPSLSPELQSFLKGLETEFDRISPERRELLKSLGKWIGEQVQKNQPAHLIVICTHNSRRSHMGQVMLALAAQYYGVPGVHTWSGGTEATAFNPQAVGAMQRAGIPVEKVTNGDNPRYRLNLDGLPEAERTLFSKRFDETPNPSQNFAAIMVCSEADEGCPFVPGAAARFSIPFRDPKESDGTPLMESVYDERLRDIGREFLFAMKCAIQ
ncbi:MAG: protein-tyrosine-phosphatase [Saprospiraceae bacterium]